jgi:hypothetical protein
MRTDGFDAESQLVANLFLGLAGHQQFRRS